MIRTLTVIAAFSLVSAELAAQPKPRSAAVAVAALSASTAPAAPRLHLHPELTATRDVVSFGELIGGLSPQDAGIAAFRAPALGETGTIQVARILEGARAAGVLREGTEVEGQAMAQVVVTRAARRITAADLEGAIKTALLERFSLDGRAFALSIDGGAPAIAVEPELTGEIAVQELSYDARSRRLQARLAVPGSTAMRLKPVRIAGQLVETVEVVVPRRAIARGETLTRADVAIERRPRDGQTQEFVADMRGAIDKVARRPLLIGMPLRSGDVQREEIVAKGDLVTILYEAPGLMISMRGRAGESGAMGDTVSITNPTSKRVLQGKVTGPGRVSVQTGVGRIASAN